MALVTWVIILGLIAANAFYVLAEFAAVSVRRSRLQKLAESGNRVAAMLLPELSDARRLDRYVAACQIGITLSSLILGAYGQATLARSLASQLEPWGWLGTAAAQSAGAIIVLVGLSALQVLFGELVPKSLALQHPIQSGLVTVVPMRWSLAVYSWFIGVLNGHGLAIMRLFRIPPVGHRHIHSPEEIDLLIAESAEHGVLEPDEQQRLRRALQLSARTASQLMVPRLRMTVLDVDTPIDDLLQLVASSPNTRLPVYRESTDNIIGLIHTRDLVHRFVTQGRIGSLDEVMQPILKVPENIRADRLLRLMREQRTQLAIVIDERGGVAGLITLQDVLEELLGEVADEFRSGEPQPDRLPDGRVRLPGQMRLHEAEPWLGILWDGDAETVGGRVTEALGHLPSPGEQTTINGVVVEVERVKDRAVESILARPLARESEDVL
jgi:putative hemolysin